MADDECEQSAVRIIEQEWGMFRDNGNWEALRGLFHPEGQIRVAWHQGDFGTFIERSMASAGKSFSKHVICNSAVTVIEDRAVAETNVILIGRGIVNDAPCHGETHMRFLDCLQKASNGRWQIADRSSVYDHDLLAPLKPGDKLELAGLGVNRWPIEYRYLAMRLAMRGLDIPSDLPVKGSNAENRARSRCENWIAKS